MSPFATQRRMIGLIGGMSWASSALYYRHINMLMEEACGPHHNARSVLYTVNFAALLEAGGAGRWDDVAATLIDATRHIARAGAECVVLTANTAHAVAAQVERDGGLPLIHIADATARHVRFGRHEPRHPRARVSRLFARTSRLRRARAR
jgi:aspartate racemase